MRKGLFVDCDDTLILYDSALCTGPDNDCSVHAHPYGFLRGESYTINEPLVASIKAYVYDNPCALTVIWSGGGARYARAIADVVLSGVDVMTLIKNKTSFHLVRPGDIVVDDMDVEVATKVYRPSEWVYTSNG